MCFLWACQKGKKHELAIENKFSVVQEEVYPAILNPSGMTIKSRFNPPEGFERIPLDTNSFAHYLRTLPLKSHGEKVHFFNGQLKSNQDVHAAIVNMDVGSRDLQQCADAVMRLRAEYLFHQMRYEDIHFNFTNGFNAEYEKWREGFRIRVVGNEVTWSKKTTSSTDYESFKQYLQQVFMYAGTLSLSKELNQVSPHEATIGNVFIQGGSPGHAVIIVDECVHPSTGERYFLFAQSYMPAQDIHVLKNMDNESNSPWYTIPENGSFETPEWIFTTGDIKSF